MEESKNENPKLKIRKSLRKSIVLMGIGFSLHLDDFKSSVSSEESQDDDLYSEFSFDYDDNAEVINFNAHLA